jgi:hypothetical protein
MRAINQTLKLGALLFALCICSVLQAQDCYELWDGNTMVFRGTAKECSSFQLKRLDEVKNNMAAAEQEIRKKYNKVACGSKSQSNSTPSRTSNSSTVGGAPQGSVTYPNRSSGTTTSRPGRPYVNDALTDASNTIADNLGKLADQYADINAQGIRINDEKLMAANSEYNQGRREIDNIHNRQQQNISGRFNRFNPMSIVDKSVDIMASVDISALSTGILLHFSNNGIDSDFASKEIHRILTEKYGMPFNLLPSQKKAEYVENYNTLSEAVEEDMKQKDAEKFGDERIVAQKEYNGALLAKHVYHPEEPIVDWSIVTPDNISKDDKVHALVNTIEQFNNDATGFYAQLYQNEITGEYTLAFRGSSTHPFWGTGKETLDKVSDKVRSILTSEEMHKNKDPDWLDNNLMNALGLSAPQYENAKEIGKLLKESGLDNVTIVGHSLGGGLGTVAGLVSGSKTFVYNSAKLTDGTMKLLELNEQHSDKITIYQDREEPLTKVQDDVNRFINGIPNTIAFSEVAATATNKSERNFAQNMVQAHGKYDEAYIEFEQDSPDNYFKTIGKTVVIDSNKEHGIDGVAAFFGKKYREVEQLNQLRDFHIPPIFESPKSGESIEYLQLSAKESGAIGIESKK